MTHQNPIPRDSPEPLQLHRISSETTNCAPIVPFVPDHKDTDTSAGTESTTPTRLVIMTESGIELPLVASPAAVAPLLGKSDHGVRNDCIAGRIPTMPGTERPGAHHKIPVARLLDQLGVPYRIERVAC
jgi:hypothetical protein